MYAGRSIDVPTLFMAGKHDWGIHQIPKALAQMAGCGCSDLRAVHLLDGAGHWLQQQQLQQCNGLILSFLGS
ncbi:MAG: pimeloyl-ACP methyl ester carboxylesterase [Paraglaciecola psychrophila]